MLEINTSSLQNGPYKMIARTVLLYYICISISNHIAVYIFSFSCALCYLYNSCYCTCNHYHTTTVMTGLLYCCYSFFNHFLTMALSLLSASSYSTIITVLHLACIEMTMWEGVVLYRVDCALRQYAFDMY